MADILHHSDGRPLDTRAAEVPNRIFLAAGIGILLIALLLAFTVSTASDPAGPMTPLTDMPFLPLVPLL